MSLATLKRKITPKMQPISSNQHAPNGFSLHGSHRRGTNCSSHSVCQSAHVHPSVLSNKGMLAKRLRWRNRGWPHAVVQPDSNSNLKDNYSSSAHLYHKKHQCNQVVSNIDAFETDNCKPECTQFIGAKKIPSAKITKSLHGMRNQSDYIDSIHQECSYIDKSIHPKRSNPLLRGNFGCGGN